jgi:type I restriction enzyme S subunit
MEVRKGYKVTELGAIPSEWRAVRFEDVLTGFTSGATPYRGRTEYFKGSIRWITSGELNYNTISETVEKITEEAVLNTNLKMLPIGTFLMAITGLEAAGTRGSCGIVGKESTTNQSCMALMPKNGEIITEYLYHFYVKYGDELAFRYCQGTKQQSYTGRIVKILPINLPPTLTEQRAIATALSDVDALIAALDRLIAKKKAIKQGAMQELLTGRRRLEGFEGAWVLQPLGKLSKITMGQSPSSSFYNSEGNGLPLIQGNADIRDRKTIIRNFTSQITKKGNRGDIIMSVRAPVGEVAKADFDCCLGRGVCSIYFPNEYLYQYLLYIEPNWSRFSSGSTFDSINSNHLSNVTIKLPIDLSEQRAIAQILTDMDTEIAALERQRDKYKTVKQGMMQELLTGKTRLI